MKDLRELNFDEKKFVVFDLDGTLIDSIGVWNEIDKDLIKMYSNLDVSLDIIQYERDSFLNNQFSGDTYLNYSQYLIERYNFSMVSKEFLTRRRVELSKRYLMEKVTFKKYVPELIRLLKELEYVIVIATMSGIKQIREYSLFNKKMKDVLNLLEVFDLIVTKDDVVNKKPHPDIFNHVVNYYGEDRDKFIVFEDSYTGVLAARNALLDVINIYDKYSDSDREEIDKLTTYKINDYLEVIELLNPRKLKL